MSGILAIDLGGTKIESAVVQVVGDSVSAPIRLRVPTERERGYEHILGQICLAAARASDQSGSIFDRLGLSMPGSIDPETGLVINANTTVLNGQPLLADLQARLETEVIAANDANCFALAESLYGAACGHSKVFGVIMGTGVGGGWVIDGAVWNGAQGIAGEWGHSILDPGGRACWCGRLGCVEKYLSGPAVEEDYRAKSGESRSLSGIVASASSDPWANEVLTAFGNYFGIALGNIVNTMDPDVIVLGGGLSQIDFLYDAGYGQILANVFHPRPRLRLLRPRLGDSAGIFGAALLAQR